MAQPPLDQEKFRKLEDALRPKDPQFPSHMRRCFMTGKQCTESHAGRSSYRQHKEEGGGDCDSSDVSIFVAMPFRSNLKTFYDWSLKPFLCDSLGIPEDRIRRADEFRNVGYVTCEKICRRIQEASLIVLDISVPNANAYTPRCTLLAA